MLDDASEPDLCPDCASTNIIRSQMRDQIICRECGLIFEPLVPQAALAPASMRMAAPKGARPAKAKPKKAAAAKKKRKR